MSALTSATSGFLQTPDFREKQFSSRVILTHFRTTMEQLSAENPEKFVFLGPSVLIS